MATEHKKLHQITEGLGIISGLYLMSIASDTKYSNVLFYTGLITFLVDSYFIGTWMK